MRSRSDQEAAAHKAKHVPIAETAARERKARQSAVQAAERKPAEKPARQVVLVLQGGGALGAYQAGVYQGLREAGIVPDWVIGTVNRRAILTPDRRAILTPLVSSEGLSR
jgi:pyruvate/2-oxoglutarate dehydrogenase complex dihydrolipoamide acyltransferase (E2) component